MGKIKTKKASLRISFMLTITGCLLTALCLSVASSVLCQYLQNEITQKYWPQYQQKINTETKQGSEDSSDPGSLKIYTSSLSVQSFYTERERFMYQALNVLTVALVPLWFILCIIIFGLAFYRKRLQKPLELLNSAADRIAENNLDFTIHYDVGDELGRLCGSVEKMRANLLENNQTMWRQMEERKRLNAAFSHDLRTPLTVLKGQSELLMRYAPEGKMTPEKIAGTAETMHSHILRLESYVSTMNRLQRLEDIELKKEDIPTRELTRQMKEIAHIICSGKKLNFCVHELTDSSYFLDISAVMQVYENLLSNALRFAETEVTVQLSGTGRLHLTVLDDGKGFDPSFLKEAAKPFHTSSKTRDSRHLGMGLYISRILCEKHGGSLTWSGSESGACTEAVFGE